MLLGTGINKPGREFTSFLWLFVIIKLYNQLTFSKIGFNNYLADK